MKTSENNLKSRYNELSDATFAKFCSLQIEENKLQEMLLHAVNLGSVESVKRILDKGLNPNFRDKNGMTALTFAIGSKNFHLVAEMMNLSLIDGSERSRPIRSYTLDVNQKSIPNPQLSGLMSTIFAAGFSYAGFKTQNYFSDDTDYYVMLVKMFLIKGKADANILDNTTRSALHYAIELDFPYISELLLLYGADPMIPDSRSETPLDIATRKGLVESQKILEFFIDGNATPEYLIERKKTIEEIFERDLEKFRHNFDFSAESQKFFDFLTNYKLEPNHIFETFKKSEKSPKNAKTKNEDNKAEHTAIDYRKIWREAMQNLQEEFLEGKTDLSSYSLGILEKFSKIGITMENGSSARGYSALHFAAFSGDSSLVEELMKNGFDVNIKTQDQASLSPLDLALKRGDRKILGKLLSDPNINFETLKDSLAQCAKQQKAGDLAKLILDHPNFVSGFKEMRKGQDALINSLIGDHKKFRKNKKIDEGFVKKLTEFREETKKSDSKNKKISKHKAKSDIFEISDEQIITQYHTEIIDEKTMNDGSQMDSELNPNAIIFMPKEFNSTLVKNSEKNHEEIDYDKDVPQFPYTDLLDIELQEKEEEIPSNNNIFTNSAISLLSLGKVLNQSQIL